MNVSKRNCNEWLAKQMSGIWISRCFLYLTGGWLPGHSDTWIHLATRLFARCPKAGTTWSLEFATFTFTFICLRLRRRKFEQSLDSLQFAPSFAGSLEWSRCFVALMVSVDLCVGVTLLCVLEDSPSGSLWTIILTHHHSSPMEEAVGSWLRLSLVSTHFKFIQMLSASHLLLKRGLWWSW